MQTPLMTSDDDDDDNIRNDDDDGCDECISWMIPRERDG